MPDSPIHTPKLRFTVSWQIGVTSHPNKRRSRKRKTLFTQNCSHYLPPFFLDIWLLLSYYPSWVILRPASVTPASCWRFCFAPPGNATNGISQPHLASILIFCRVCACNVNPASKGKSCSAGRSLRSLAAFSSIARRCISSIRTSASSLKSRREGGDFSPARSAGCLYTTKQESRRDGRS